MTVDIVEVVARSILREAGFANDPKIQDDLAEGRLLTSQLYAKKYARAAIQAALRAAGE